VVISPAGSGGTFNFTCGTLPTNALCLFNPSTETLSAGAQGNVEVEISTGNGSTVRLERSSPNQTGFWRALPLVCGLLALPLAVSRRRKLWLLVALTVVCAAGVSSCTSSGGGTGGTGGQGGGSRTPAGTYTIPVSVTSMGITHQVSVTLTVD